MKAFWTFIMVLVLAAGGMVLKEFRSGTETTTGAVQETAGTAGDGAIGGAIKPGPMPPVDAPSPAVDPAPIEGEFAEPNPITETPAVIEDPADEPIVVDVGVADEPTEVVELQGEPAPLAGDAAVEGTPSEAATEPDEDPEAESAYTLMLNDRWGITGSGTTDDPYAIDFDMLIALEQDYEPKTEGKTKVPDWIKPLDGKYVIITGFIGFPFIAPTADECMVMLNQWDGCCIGVPPTTYDAVEVVLAEPIDLQQGVINYGTLVGVFRTDPYLVNGWLIGLYVMDEARLESGGSKNQSGF